MRAAIGRPSGASSRDTDMFPYPMSAFPALAKLRQGCRLVAEIDGVTLCVPASS